MPRRSGPLQSGQRVVVRMLGGVREARVRMKPGSGDAIRSAYALGVRLHGVLEDEWWARGWKSAAANALRTYVAME